MILWLCDSGRNWRWQRLSDARSSVRWHSMSSRSRALYGRCMYWSTEQQKRSTPVSSSGRSGRNSSLLQLVSPVDLCSCTFSARCTSSYVTGGVRTTVSSMCRIAQAVHHIGRAAVDTKLSMLMRCVQMWLQSLNTRHVLLTSSQRNYSCYSSYLLLPRLVSTE